MEEQILKIMSDRTHPMAGHSWLIGLDLSDCQLCSEEITSMVFEFMEWAVRKEMLQYSGSAEEWQTTCCGNYLNLEELFQYWWDNVKNK
jgi:hypothetical protein